MPPERRPSRFRPRSAAVSPRQTACRAATAALRGHSRTWSPARRRSPPAAGPYRARRWSAWHRRWQSRLRGPAQSGGRRCRTRAPPANPCRLPKAPPGSGCSRARSNWPHRTGNSSSRLLQAHPYRSASSISAHPHQTPHAAKPARCRAHDPCPARNYTPASR